MEGFVKLFSTMQIGSKISKNRIGLSPMGEGMATPAGEITDQYKAYYIERAKGGAGIISIGYLNVDYPRGSSGPQARIDDHTNLEALKDIINQCHEYGALVIPQLHHAGGQTTSMATGGVEPWTPSDKECEHIMVKGMRTVGPQHAMTLDEVHFVRDQFIKSAVNLKKAGADGATIHSGHGYLISEFLTPDFNARTDEYGGSLENRARILTEIIEGIRRECGPDFIIGARIPGKEFVPNGLSDEECAEIARLCEKAGCDFLDVTVGAISAFSNMIETEKYPQGSRVPFAEKIKAAVNIPVGVSGTLRDPEFCEAVIENEKVDFVYLARALLCDPYWPEKAKTGRANEIRKCMSCSEGCMRSVMEGSFASCVINPVTGRELQYGSAEKAESAKSVVVIGGGIAGMQAAIVASDRGHQVILLEKADHLGGQLDLACIPPDKGRVREAKEWFAAETERKQIEVRYNTEATVELIQEINPDEVILATGAVPVTRLPIEGCENALQAWDVIGGIAPIPEHQHVTVVGGGLVACELTEMLLEKGNQVTMIEMLPQIANGMEMMHSFDLTMSFMAAGVEQKTNATVKSIAPNAVTFEQEGELMTKETDKVILAVGQKSYGKELGNDLIRAGYHVQVIGDAEKASKIQNATLTAYAAAYSI
ncbi:MAG: NAD(P)/FAD-dependent oxidoreductase [Eubacteriales bacterium]|nr:NAD(P)/FAD-dependent oxidoreductase [Eubacteriales bacterium]